MQFKQCMQMMIFNVLRINFTITVVFNYLNNPMTQPNHLMLSNRRCVKHRMSQGVGADESPYMSHHCFICDSLVSELMQG